MTGTTLEFKDISFSKSRISDQVKEVLKNAVLELKPGDRIPSEDAMARQLQVSKVTIRAAMGGLEAEGLVERRRGVFGGNFVAKPSSEKMGELVMNYYRMGDVTPEDFLEFRRILEPPLVELAADRRTEAELEPLRLAIDQTEKALKEGNTHSRAYHLEFHYLIADACHNALTSHVMRALSTVFDKILDQVPITIEELQGDNDYHKQMYECLVRRDGKKAREIMVAHFDTLKDIIERSRTDQKTGRKKKPGKV